MTSRERLLTAFKRGRPDRVPVTPYGLGKIDPQSALASELIEKTDFLITVETGREFSHDIFFGSAPIEEQQDGNITTWVVNTPKGELVQKLTRTEITAAITECYFKDKSDFEKYLSLPYHPAELDLKRYLYWKERVKDNGFILACMPSPVDLPGQFLSPENFCLAWLDDPAWLEDMCAVMLDRLIAYAQRLCSAGLEGFRVLGGEIVSTQLGPRAFEKIMVPYDKKLVSAIRKEGAIAYYHNHGKVMDYLDMFLEIGPDAIDPFEAPPGGDADLRKIKAKFKGKICIVGNLDDMEVLDKLDQEEVLRIGRQRIREAGPDGFVLGGTASGTYGEKAARNFIALAGLAP